ncbi:MAG: glycoside hydrolase family 2 [Dorea sp.]|uniref:glycoside hydrolase family 2 protein n=1 Tax=Sporofaciens musculi TaxID=2681861 RepID=UPI00216ED033|nr:sugar-binding domain-containing protein [Sporofaciens musculi]MCI9421285.1 glycoside hydrolase family 2 [Dorea sp.]
MRARQLKTKWAEGIDGEHVLGEYPRPLLQRESYVNLNGYWDYGITREGEKLKSYDGRILVPFSPEAWLSGVRRQLKPRESLWYHRTLPEEIYAVTEGRWLLHFGAVDQYAVVSVNGKVVKRHLGGYLPFSVDVTDFLQVGKNELTVQVRDYSDTFYYSRGKQKLKRGGMFYTAQSGIWQTVWMEKVPDTYIKELTVTPLYDESAFLVKVKMAETRLPSGSLVNQGAWEPGSKVAVTISSKDTQPFQIEGHAGQDIRIPISDMRSWSPETPFLYDIEVTAGRDHAKSYAAMRKISVEKDGGGIPRIFLNNQPYFQCGVLDQGYWPEGLYTPPCDEAMVYDIRAMKELGFNMIRKHVKLEPQRWYYHCDRIGMLVWQDMVNGGRRYQSWYVTYLATAMEYFHLRMQDSMLGLLGRRDEKGRRQFVSELRETIHILYNHPSVVTWVIFNEGWGQFHGEAVTQIAREADKSRLIDQASGWFDQGGGDVRSIHDYFFPLHIKAEKRVTALTEFGGYSLSIQGHHMYRKVYGYRIYRKKSELTRGYRQWIEREILPNIEKGLSAIVYTQLSDVEEETNGILTYDREVLKLKAGTVRGLNEKMKQRMLF